MAFALICGPTGSHQYTLISLDIISEFKYQLLFRFSISPDFQKSRFFELSHFWGAYSSNLLINFYLFTSGSNFESRSLCRPLLGIL